MKYFITFCIAVTVALSISTSCDKPVEYDFSQDSVRGLWGTVELFNQFGEQAGSLSNIQIVAHVSDTMFNFNNNSTEVLDTIITTYTNDKGEWEMRRTQGYYTIEIQKEGFGKNQIFQYRYDTTRADTLPTIYLAMKPQGLVTIDSVSVTNNILDISRTISFVGSRDYALSVWYFFDTLASVSNERYAYVYMAGAKNSGGLPLNSMTIQKPLDKLYASGIHEGQQVYVRAYADNYKYVRYQIDSALWVYPNITEGSNVLNFTMPPLNEE
ncbi:MAG: hypothetical protein LBM68_06060 [Bacteroidales bacterium]|jgi:hypothetical protein|nr:hypothetical protein [Bacteroidales bacterium]